MSYEYEDELERMKKRRQERRQGGGSSRNNVRRKGRERGEEDFLSERQEAFENRKIRHSRAMKKKRRRKRIFLIVEIIALIILAAVIFSIIKKKTDDGYWTIAVFGVDSRDGKLGKGALSDVEMLFNINKETGEVKVVSVYRDTYLKISSDEYHKINEAYFKGGPDQALAALEENLDLQIDSYATFNWKAVVDAINILGGVDVEISEAEFAYINSFITETVNATGVGSYQLQSPGMNHLDGVQAVAYARLRLMDTDFNRTARQRKIVELAMEKAKNADWATRYNVLAAVFPQISTNIGIDDVVPMAQKINDYHITETTGFPFSREAKMIGKMDCVIPTTLESNVVQLHQLLFDDTDYTAPSSVRKISAKIAEDSGLTEVGENAAPAKTGGGIVPKQTEAAVQETVAETVEETIEEETSEEETLEETEEETTSPDEESEPEETEEEIGPGSGLKPTIGPVQPGDSDKKPDISESSGSYENGGSHSQEEKPSASSGGEQQSNSDKNMQVPNNGQAENNGGSNVSPAGPGGDIAGPGGSLE